MKKHNVPTVSSAAHDGHDDTKATTPSLLKVVSSCRRVLRASRPSTVLRTALSLSKGRRLGVAAVILAASSACVRTVGEPIIQRPALEVPPPPPRVITPLPVPEAPPVEEPIEDPAVPKPPSAAKPKPPAQNAGKPEVKLDTPPAEVTPSVPAPATPPAPPQPTLTTPPQGDANAVSRQIRDSIERTRRALEKIDYGPLSNERKKAYDDAKLFATQAEDAVKLSNLVFAKELADKAERLAKELQGR